MRLKDYGRNQKKRKEYIHSIGLLFDGMDVNMTKHDAAEELWGVPGNRSGLRRQDWGRTG